MSKIINLMIIGVSLLLACSLDSPKAPSWDMPFNVPLANKRYFANELAHSKDDIVVLQSGLLGFQINGKIDTTYIDDHLQLPDVADSAEVNLNELKISSVLTGTDQFFFSQLYSDAKAYHDSYAIVAPFSFENIKGSRLQNSDFDYADLLSGQAQITIKNTLPVDLHNIRLSLYNQSSDIMITQLDEISNLPASDSLAVVVDLSNSYVASVCYWIISGNSPGSHGSSVFIDKDAPVNIVTELTNFSIDEARLRVPPATLSRKIDLALNPDMILTEAGFKSGVIQVDVINDLPLDMTLQFTLNEFTQKNTLKPLTWQIQMNPLRHEFIKVDLSDYILHLPEPQSETVQKLKLYIKGGSLSTTSGLVDLSTKNTAKTIFSFRNCTIDYFKGKMQEQKVPFKSTQKELRLPGELGSLKGITFGIARMHLEIYNAIQMPFRLDGIIEGHNEEGQKAEFYVNQRIQASNGSGETVTLVPDFTSENSTILDFMNMLPTHYVISGDVYIGDGNTFGSVQSSDHVRATFLFESGAEVKFNDRSVHIDTTKLYIEPDDFNGEVPDKGKSISADITNKLRSVRLLAHIQNHLPIGFELYFKISEDSTRLQFNPDVTIGPARLLPAEVDDQGRIVQAVQQDIDLGLPEKDIWIFQNEIGTLKKIYIATDLFVPGTGGKVIQLFGSDFIQVQTLAQFKLQIKNE